MRQLKRAKLKKAGWRVSSAREFLALNDAEARLVDLKITLLEGVRRRRERRELTQIQLAKLIESSESRVSKMEAGDPSVSIDLLVRSLLALGTTLGELARMIGAVKRAA